VRHILDVVIVAVALACMALVFLFGHLFGFRQAVRTDYLNCAENIRQRDEDQGDLKPSDPPYWNEWCAEHGDSVYGGKGWRP
jgi:hypothetical protein